MFRFGTLFIVAFIESFKIQISFLSQMDRFERGMERRSPYDGPRGMMEPRGGPYGMGGPRGGPYGGSYGNGDVRSRLGSVSWRYH